MQTPTAGMSLGSSAIGNKALQKFLSLSLAGLLFLLGL